MKSFEETIPLQPNEESSTAGYISWARLETQLRKAGELKPNEIIQRFVVDNDGLKYYVLTNKETK